MIKGRRGKPQACPRRSWTPRLAGAALEPGLVTSFSLFSSVASSLQTRAADRGWDEERIQAPSGSSLRRSLESEGVRSEPPDPVGGISPSLR